MSGDGNDNDKRSIWLETGKYILSISVHSQHNNIICTLDANIW
jgi:hypothetical protein